MQFQIASTRTDGGDENKSRTAKSLNVSVYYSKAFKGNLFYSLMKTLNEDLSKYM